MAVVNDGSCQQYEVGCKDSLALNYNIQALLDDGSCEYQQFGCTDTTALNYNPSATDNDGSCDYSYHACSIPQQFTGNTGSNMTVFFTSNIVNDLHINYKILRLCHIYDDKKDGA